jgi:hypothetical protein
VKRRPSTDDATADTEASSERRVGAGAVATLVILTVFVAGYLGARRLELEKRDQLVAILTRDRFEELEHPVRLAVWPPKRDVLAGS